SAPRGGGHGVSRPGRSDRLKELAPLGSCHSQGGFSWGSSKESTKSSRVNWADGCAGSRNHWFSEASEKVTDSGDHDPRCSGGRGPPSVGDLGSPGIPDPASSRRRFASRQKAT